MSYKSSYKGLPIEVMEEGDTVDTEGAIILVAKQTDGPPAPGASGDRVCSGCQAPVWLHSTSTDIAPNAQLVCMQCMLLLLKKEIN